MRKIFLLILLALLFLSACGAPGAVPTPASFETASPVPTPGAAAASDAPGGEAAEGPFAASDGENTVYIIPGSDDAPHPADYLVLLTADGTRQTLLTGRFESLNACGGYAYYIDALSGDVCRIAMNGPGEREVLSPCSEYGKAHSLAVAETGEAYFLSSPDGKSCLWRVSPDGQPERLATFEGRAGELALCGGQLYYNLCENGLWASYRMCADGSTEKLDSQRLSSFCFVDGRMACLDENSQILISDAGCWNCTPVGGGIKAGALASDGKSLYYSDGPIVRRITPEGEAIASSANPGVQHIRGLAAINGEVFISDGARLLSAGERGGTSVRADRVAGPWEASHVYTNAPLGLSLAIPEALSKYISIGLGVPAYNETGPSLSIYYLPAGERHGLLFSIAVVPRDALFDPSAWYNGIREPWELIALNAGHAYLRIPFIGGPDSGQETLGEYLAAADKFSAEYLRGCIEIEGADSIPELTPEAVLAEVAALESAPAETMTRAEGAVWAFGLLAADNKEEEYPLRFSDVEPGTEAAHAIAYLDSYGIFFGHDSAQFRPGGKLTRAEFVQLLQRLMYIPWPQWYGEGITAQDVRPEHWAWDYLNRAVQDGWLEADSSGRLRPDEPIDTLEIAYALNAAYGQTAE